MCSLTPWFTTGEAPVHPGVYNVSCQKENQSGDWYARWDGERWFHAHTDVHNASRDKKAIISAWHWRGSWRGLIKE